MLQITAPMKRKMAGTALVALSLFLLLITRPWKAASNVDYSKLPEGATVILILKDPWGREVTKVYSSELGERNVLYGSTQIMSLSTQWPEPITLDITINGQTQSYTFTGRLDNLPEPYSDRRNPSVIFGIALFVGFFATLFFLLWVEWETRIRFQRKSQFFIIALVLGFGSAIYLLTPGFFGWDIFSYYVGATRFGGSTFIGRLLSLLLVAGTQLIPEFWIYTAFSVFITALSLYHIHAFACRQKVEKWFYPLLFVFLIYPANFYFIFFPIRDVPATWCFAMTLLKVYEIWIERTNSWPAFGWLGFFSICAVGMRQEAFLPITLSLIISWWWANKAQRQKYLTVAVATVTMWFGLNYEMHRDQLQHDIYQTTLLINPLSSILVEKYPNGLPAEVDRKLGKYFKNDFLISHFSPYDINPFHFGGVDRQNATHETYVQFRSAALEIMWENPQLWLKNRYMLGMDMFGFDPQRFFYVEDNFYKPNASNIPIMVHSVPMHTRARWNWVQSSIEFWKSAVSRSTLLVQSFLIPLILGAGMIILARGRMFYFLSSMLFLRTLIVLTVAPASYYRYQFSVWIFLGFALVYVMAERKNRLKEKSSRILAGAVDLGTV